ncbi:GyrI-like domain-containing protein [Clostridium sp. BJN0013]|uniref:GyrI-like domain-containing protein n=1 Tax=Clostridium sp. BJN0013 TaxID=3236840 RepID=UPI0034C6670C
MAYLSREYSLGDDIEYPIRITYKLWYRWRYFLEENRYSYFCFKFKSHKFDTYSGIFIVLEDEDKIITFETTFPSRRYLRIRFKGIHVDAADCYKKLFAHMKRHDYELTDDSIEVTLINYGITNDIDKYVTEILLPYTRI